VAHSDDAAEPYADLAHLPHAERLLHHHHLRVLAQVMQTTLYSILRMENDEWNILSGV
jgi:hypothetical protein